MDLISTKECTMFNEVNDECDIASILEEMERENSVRHILMNVPPKRDIDALIDVEKRCDWCDDIIPIARQRIVLTLHKTCDYCVECQQLIEKQDLLYWG